MKFKLPGIVTAVGAAAAMMAAVCAPSAASAATKSTDALLDVSPYRMGNLYPSLTWSNYVYYKTIAGTDHYDIIVSGAGKTQTVSSPGYGFEKTGRQRAVVVNLDPCVSYVVKVGARDANGNGPTSRGRLANSIRPGGVLKASAKRGTDPTTATFTWTPPAVRGHTNEYGMSVKEVVSRPTPLSYQTELVRMSDNKVVKSYTIAANTITGSVSHSVTGLDRKGAYVLRVKATNAWGTCDNKAGRILLNRVS
ncbi:hypothetical protein [Actinoplanes sp. NPDC051859]|uniref:hypothetical protein n=1 Tax=Actinoplanes sp. NPDC051859 TaxID=3363909 RepID=UPI00378A1261